MPRRSLFHMIADSPGIPVDQNDCFAQLFRILHHLPRFVPWSAVLRSTPYMCQDSGSGGGINW